MHVDGRHVHIIKSVMATIIRAVLFPLPGALYNSSRSLVGDEPTSTKFVPIEDADIFSSVLFIAGSQASVNVFRMSWIFPALSFTHLTQSWSWEFGPWVPNS